jgi:hypothetical protein
MVAPIPMAGLSDAPFDRARISEELFRHADLANTYPIGIACAVSAD